MPIPSIADQSLSEIETLEYVSSLAGELAEMARQRRHDLLAYLLDMAHEEARKGAGRSMIARRAITRPDEGASEIRLG